MPNENFIDDVDDVDDTALTLVPEKPPEFSWNPSSAGRQQQAATEAVDPARFILGSYAQNQLATAENRVDWKENISLGFRTNVLFKTAQKMNALGPFSLFGYRPEGPGYDKIKALADMPTYLDRHTIANILDEDTEVGYLWALRQAKEQYRIGAVMSDQPMGSGIAQMFGMFADVDLALVFATGGAFGSIKVAVAARRMAKTLGLNSFLTKRLVGTMAGVNMGGQTAGLIAGLDLTQSVTTTWQDAAQMFLGITLFGTGIGLTTGMHSRLYKSQQAAVKELRERIVDDKPQNMNGDLDTMHSPAEVAMPPRVWDGPVVGEGVTSEARTIERMEAAKLDEAVTLAEEKVRTAQEVSDTAEHGTKGAKKKALAEAKLAHKEALATRAVLDEGQVVGGGAEAGAGATVVPGGGLHAPETRLVDPHGPIPPEQVAAINRALEWRHVTDFLSKKMQDSLSVWTKVMTSKIGSFGMSQITEMYTSKSAMMNWWGGVHFESPAGLNRGRATSSALMENYHTLMQTPIAGEIWQHMNEWAKANNMTWWNSGFFISREGVRKFHRDLMLERNARHMNATTGSTHVLSEDPPIKQAADKYDEAGFRSVDIAQGREGQLAIDGAERWTKTPGWNPYRWLGQSFTTIVKMGVPVENIIKAMVEGYEKAGLIAGKDASLVAKAVMRRSRARADDMDSSTASLLTADGRAYMRKTLIDDGIPEATVNRIMRNMTGTIEDRMKEGFAKSRNNIDLSIAIENDIGMDLRLVDLLDNDMQRVWQRYTRQVSGAAALARNGLTNRAQRQVAIEATQAEMRALGEVPLDGDAMHALLSHFNGGPVWGYHGGNINYGLEPLVVIAKRLTGLALLERLAFPQLGETGATISQVGVQNWYRRGPMALWDAEMRTANKAILDEISYITGKPGIDNLIYMEWADMDELSMVDRGKWTQAIASFTSNMAFIQMYTSLFNSVRKYQQQIALAGMTDKVFRTIREDTITQHAGFGKLTDLIARFENDFGLGMAEINHFKELIDNGVIEFNPEHGYVTKMNFHQWDPDILDNFGAGMRRGMNQTIQKAMAGEQDAWMSTIWGSLMVHLKTFPMLAVQKQFMRNGRMMDMMAVTAMFFGLGTAFVAMNIVDVLTGRERTQKQKAIDAFGYNNITSWIPMVTDPVLTAVGLQGWRLQPYGRNASLIPPTMTTLDNMWRAPGAIPKILSGNADYYDWQAFNAVPFMGTYLLSNIVADAARKSRGSPKRPAEVNEEDAPVTAVEPVASPGPLFQRLLDLPK